LRFSVDNFHPREKKIKSIGVLPLLLSTSKNPSKYKKKVPQRSNKKQKLEDYTTG